MLTACNFIIQEVPSKWLFVPQMVALLSAIGGLNLRSSGLIHPPYSASISFFSSYSLASFFISSSVAFPYLALSVLLFPLLIVQPVPFVSASKDDVYKKRHLLI